MATVYLAEDLKHHRKVAVKVLRLELAAGTDFYHQDYDVAADGRFVMIRRYQTDTVEEEMVVVENWFEEVKARMANQ